MAATIGFVGLDRLGLPMAWRLMDAGHPVTVFDRAEGTIARRGRRADDLAAVSGAAEIVFAGLPTPDIEEAEAPGVPMAVGGALRQFLAMTNAAFGPEADVACMAKLAKGRAGVEMGGRG